MSEENITYETTKEPEAKGVDGVLERYMNDVLIYLDSKLPKTVPIDISMDIATFVSARATVLIADAIYENNKVWQESLKTK